MVLPEKAKPLEPTIDIVKLSSADAPEMVALTTLAFPGFFRARTWEMGEYYGVRCPSGELIAMGGERLALEGHSEISGVCTHPSFRGQGLAAGLIWHLVRNHRRADAVSWLHVGCANNRAIDLYLGMGFQSIRKVMLHRMFRRDSRTTN